jgi:RNA polymerase sigma-70 factor, ECF subfamily
MIDDGRLVEACLEGDGRAFTLLVDRYRYPVYGLCLSYTGDFDAAEDAAQEALISAYTGLRKLSEPRRFGPWLRRIAANQCRTYLRREHRRVPLSEELEEKLVDPARNPEERVIDREERQQVLETIGRLSQPQQEAVVLFYLEERPLKQVADFLEISVQTVEQRLYRARHRLKEEWMDMVEKILKDQQLPEGFTREVVEEALKRGRESLEEQDWTAARREFGRITGALPEHVEASRGLAMAFNGEVREALREARRFGDRRLLQETLAALRRAYELGADDIQVVRAISSLCFQFGQHREGGQFLEQAAARRDDWKESIGLLKSGIATYYHAYYSGRGNNMEDCVRCHRRIRELAPADLEPRRRFTIWQPAGMSMAYAHVGASEEVFAELDALRAEIGGEWSVQEHFQWTSAYTNQHKEMGKWDEVIEHSRRFVDWAKGIPDDDPRLFIAPIGIDSSQDHRIPDREHAGEWFRWWTVCYTLARIAKSLHSAGRDSTPAFAELEEIWEQQETRCRSMERQAEENPGDEDLRAEAEEQKRRLTGLYAHAIEAAYEAGRYEETVRVCRLIEELGGALSDRDPLYIAAALVALGQVAEGKERLRNIYGAMVTKGQCRAYFAKCREFDGIREEPEIVALVAEWEGVEQVWQE